MAGASLVSAALPAAGRLSRRRDGAAPQRAGHPGAAPAPAAAAPLGPRACAPQRRAPPAPAAAAPAVRSGGPSTAERIEAAFLDAFWGATEAPRVLDSFRRLQAGQEVIQDHPGQGRQHANSFIQGLTAQAFPDAHGGAYPWLEAVEARAADIWGEFQRVTADPEALASGNAIWVPAVRAEAVAYGPDWRTLVLQDRGRWEPANSALFPVTSRLFKDLQAPTLEVFFARQPPRTGIQPHTDYVNFINTSHLGLQVPPGPDCWIKCGDHTRHWEAGRVLTMDTSFIHSTSNGTDTERIVLIMRHFHPELTPLERSAAQFLFDCLDDPSPEGLRAARRRVDAARGAGRPAGGAGFGGAGGGARRKAPPAKRKGGRR